MSDQFEQLHPRSDAGRFAEKPQQDPGGSVLTVSLPKHQHEMWQIREGTTHFYCAACGDSVRVMASVTDRDGRSLPPCPVQVEVSYRGGRPQRYEFDAATILAGMSLDERRQLLDDDTAVLYKHATDQFLLRWEMGDVIVTNAGEVRLWVEAHRDAALAGEGWLETHGDGGWITVQAVGEDMWAAAAARAQDHVERFNRAGRVAVVVHNWDDFEVNPANDLAEATDHVRAAGFYASGVTHGSYASFVDGDLSTDRSATIYFPAAG